MTDGSGTSGRRQWVKPSLRRIEAGAAEASAKTGVADGGTCTGSPSCKNFS